MRGNHDQALLDFLEDPKKGEAWFTYGGRETLGAYGVGLVKMTGSPEEWRSVRARFAEFIPDAHLDFLKSTKFSHAAGDFLFVHAGVDPKRSLGQQRPHDLMWIREPFLTHRKRFEKFIVHGHSPTEAPDWQKNRLGVDTCAYGTGRLTAAIIDQSKNVLETIQT